GLHGVRVAKARLGAGLASDHAVEVGADLVGGSRTNRMTRGALCEDFLAGFRILSQCKCRQCKQGACCDNQPEHAWIPSLWFPNRDDAPGYLLMPRRNVPRSF